jgi:peptidoglycan/LPS O-acetylase OafA/YrhL
MRNTAPDRIFGLDIIRAIAILMVVVFHSAILLSPLSQLPTIGNFIHKILSLTEPLGILGVELFFVLSGFLIGTILIKSFTRSEKFGFADIKNFLVRRWFRTLPNYWLILILNIIIFQLLNLRSFSTDQLGFFLFIQNIWHDSPAFFPESWSLAIEEWFYITLPLVIFFISVVFKALGKRYILLMAFIVYALFFLAMRILLADHHVTDPLYFDGSVRKIVLLRLDAISYGFFMAYLFYYHKESIIKARTKLLIVSIAGILLLTFIHFAGIYPAFDFYRKYFYFRLFVNTLFLTLIPFFFSLSIPFAYAVKSIKQKRLSVVIATISQISYSLYLVHFSLVFLPMMKFIKLTTANCIFYYGAYWIVVIVISLFLYRYFEKPVMELRQKFSKKDPAI